MRGVGARAPLILAVAALSLVVGVAVYWTVSKPPTQDGARLDGPVASKTEVGVAEVGTSERGEMTDWGMIRLHNRAADAAIITKVVMVAGGGSDRLLHEEGFFVLGIDRSFGNGTADAPSDASWWGTELEPAIGHEIPGTDIDKSGMGLALVIRLGLGADEDGSFKGVEVYYVWHGHEYKAYFNQTVLMCDADPPKYRPPTLCAKDWPPPEPIDWPSSEWDDD